MLHRTSVKKAHAILADALNAELGKVDLATLKTGFFQIEDFTALPRQMMSRGGPTLTEISFMGYQPPSAVSLLMCTRSAQ